MALTVELPADGDYRIVVFRQRTRERDNETYTLTLDVAGGIRRTRGWRRGGGRVGVWRDGERRLGEENVEDRWTFEGRAGDVITLVMERAVDELGGLDGYLVLLGPDGATLAKSMTAPTMSCRAWTSSPYRSTGRTPSWRRASGSPTAFRPANTA